MKSDIMTISIKYQYIMEGRQTLKLLKTFIFFKNFRKKVTGRVRLNRNKSYQLEGIKIDG